MISHEFARDQIKRLASLAYFPTFAPAITTLIETLEECARSEAHARAVIDECLRQHGCPEPADLRNAAWSLLTDEQRSGGRCIKCRGEGWLTETRSVKGKPYEFAKRCGCNPGSSEAA